MISKRSPAPENVEAILSLTSIQEGMLFHHLKEPGSHFYFEQLCLDIAGKMNMEAFKGAWKTVVETNEMLRTVFRWEKLKSPVQIVLKTHEPTLRFYDFSEKKIDDAEGWVEAVKVWDREDNFDLREVPFRVTLCTIETDRFELIISNHHILYDGWSSSIILEEFFQVYTHLVTCPGKALEKPAKTKFSEFIRWSVKSGEDRQNCEAFWNRYLEGFEPGTGLPIKLKKSRGSGVGKSTVHHSWLGGEKQGRLDTFIKDHKVTLASFLYGAWGLLLQRYGNCSDVAFGTTISGRSAKVKGIERMVGLFINTLPLRITRKTEENSLQFIRRIHRDLQEREMFNRSSLVEIKEYMVPGDSDELFDTLVVLDNYPLDKELKSKNSKGGLFLNAYSVVEMTHYDLTLGITTGGDICIDFLYLPGVFEHRAILRLAGHFLTLMEDILLHPEKKTAELEIMTSEEKQRLLFEFNDTESGYLFSLDTTLHHLLEQQALKTPDHIAVVGSMVQHNRSFKESPAHHGHNYEDDLFLYSLPDSLTYREFNNRANRLARLLRERGVEPGAIVGLKIDRTIEMMIGILGILKAGCAYLPIDPDSPDERTEYILADSAVKLVVDAAAFLDHEGHEDFEEYSQSHFQSRASLAYVIYTSGSTGRPKGVVVEHRSLLVYLNAFLREFDITEETVIVQQASFTFDTFSEEVYPVLLKGGRLVIPSKDDVRDIFRLVDIILQQCVTVVDCSPLLLAQLNRTELVPFLKHVKIFISGGDALKGEYVNNLLTRGQPIYNTYGPTEATVCASYFKQTGDIKGNIPIGKPIANYNIYILDHLGYPQPEGVPGELCIGGPGVARGYLNNPELTAERFVIGHSSLVNSASDDQCPMTNDRLYRTGDLARWLPGGNLEFLGRIDLQVKIRGYRLELGEIEVQLRNHNAIDDAAVAAPEDAGGEKYLCAYVVCAKKKLKKSDLTNVLREYLSARLPDYMIPAHFIQLDEIPLTPSGKLDRRALPKPETEIAAEKVIPPRDEVERKLATIWSELLNIPRHLVGIDSNFFSLGGHSLKAAGLTARIHKEMEVKVPLKTVFEMPVIEKLATYIKALRKDAYHEIEPVETREFYPLSSAQKQIYVLQQMAENSTGYNMTEMFESLEPLDMQRLRGAFKQLIRRHESLRTSFIWVGKRPVQRIHRQVTFEIEEYELENPEQRSGNQTQEEVYADIARKIVRPFDLARAPLLRVSLLKVNGSGQIMLVDMHHIISDGVSHGILVQDFTSFYGGKSPAPLKIQYKDFSQWLNRGISAGALKVQEEYWLKEFSEEVEALHLPTDYRRPSVQSFEGDTVSFEVESRVFRSLKTYSLELGVTHFVTLIGLYFIFLAKISSNETIVVGTPTAGRRLTELEPVMGMFVNTLAVKGRVDPDQTFEKFLNNLGHRMTHALENGDYPFENLVERIAVTREPGHNPLFDTMFALEADGDHTAPPPLIRLPMQRWVSKFDLTLSALESGDDLFCEFEYATRLFDKNSIHRFVAYFNRILQQVLAEPEQRIAEIEVIPEQEKLQIVEQFNDTERTFPEFTNVYRLFEQQAEKIPHRTALVYKESLFTYNELERRACQLAETLKKKGMMQGNIAAVMLDQSPEVMISVLAIWKVGGAYLPISPGFPQSRIDFLLADSRAKVLVSESSKANMVSKDDGRIEIDIHRELMKSPIQPAHPAPSVHSSHSNHSNHPCYIIYTSGTTGEPRGAVVPHGAIINRMYWLQERFAFDETDVILRKTPITFDVSVCEMTRWMLGGGRMSILPGGEEKDPAPITRAIIKHGVTVIEFVPPMLTLFLDFIRDVKLTDSVNVLRWVFVGGEAAGAPLVNTFNRMLYHTNGTRLINAYGPTEAAVDVTVFDCSLLEKPGTVPIGKPIANTRILMLDRSGRLQPIGVSGELCISGKSLALGYLNRPELTAEKFVISHLSLVISNPNDQCPVTNDRFYHTGDLARWLPDGTIEFLGRIDQQVKIRGIRIEPGEVERHLSDHPAIKAAVVITRRDLPGQKDNGRGGPGEQYLCAYIVVEEETAPGQSIVGELREFLNLRVPEYMVPAYFVPLDAVPITAHGKVDTKALPEPGAENRGEKYTAPRDWVEEKLVEIWSEILGKNKERISIDANFFHLGGHSLRAVVMAANIHKVFDCRIPVAEIFKTPFIRGLAGYIRLHEKENHNSIEAAEKRDYYPLSSSQKRLYVLYSMDEDGVGYNMPIAMELNGKLDRGLLENTFRQLIRRHESLRTSFITVNEEPAQKIHARLPFEVWFFKKAPSGQWSIILDDIEFLQTKLPPRSLYSHYVPKPVPMTTIIENFIYPFVLTRPPLLRAGLMQVEEEKHVLLVDMHHIVSDGVSTAILIDDFISLYSGKTLEPLRLQYKDFSQWQHRQEKREEFSKQADFWLEQFKGEIPVLDLPADFPRPAVRDFGGNTLHFELGIEETRALTKTAQKEGVTLFMLLLALYTVFLNKVSNQSDIVVGTPAAGRRHVDLEPIIGLFIDTLALRNRPMGEYPFNHFLGILKKRTLACFENQDYHFEDIVEKVAIKRDSSRNPLFDTMFILDTMDLEMQTAQLADLEVRTYQYETESSKFDLTLTTVEAGPRLSMEFEYSTALFKKSTVERFISYFKRILGAVLQDRHREIRRIEMIREDEKEKILLEFNNTRKSFADDVTLHELFDSRVKRSAHKIAIAGTHVKHPGHDNPGTLKASPVFISYGELDRRSNRLARELKKRGAGPDRIAAVIMDRSPELIVTILAILKTGAAYLPIEPEYPQERIEYMLRDSSTKVAVGASSKLALDWETANCQLSIVNYELLMQGPAESLHESPVPTPAPSPAYIIYTSGSTGRPKGVIVEHGSAVNLLFALQDIYPFGENDTYLLKTPVVFDVSISELFGWYPGGGRLAVLEKGAEKDPQSIMDAVHRHHVTHINFVPSMFNAFSDALVPAQGDNEKLTSIKYIFLAGEALLPGMVKNFRTKNSTAILENLYGPTEATVYASAYSLRNWNEKDNIPIGTPLGNYRMVILNRWGQVQPIGVTGELCISGIGVARGYLNNPELTAARFVIGHLSLANDPLYRTGDLACWLPDGNIEYLGRIDLQVKIRGYRIELGEIENRLTEHPHINEAIVVVKQDKKEDKYLCAYIVYAGKERKTAELKKFLAAGLPEYMIPTYFITLDRMPVKASGKIDKGALPAPEIVLKEKYTAPANETEHKLAAMWSDILDIPAQRISTTASFFQLGGHSLKATILSSRIRKEFDVVFSLSTIFNGPTIQDCAEHIMAAGKRIHERISAVEKKEYYPQSSAQKRLFILEHFEDIGIAYNMPVVLHVKGGIDGDYIKQVILRLIRRHECLRTSFFMKGEEAVQRIHDAVPFEIEFYDAGKEDYIETFIRPFDLSSAPLLRVGLVHLGPGKDVLMADINHIIGDGVSTEILMDEFVRLYNGETLAPLVVQYKDFSLWQDHLFKSGHIRAQEEYWLNVFHDADDIPHLNLPVDFPRPPIFNFEGDNLDFVLDSETAAAFKRLGEADGSTLYMGLLAVLNLVFFKYTGQEDIVIGGVVAGRRHAHLQDIVGMFVNTISLRCRPQGELTFTEFLGQVRDNCLNAFENQDVPFETLVEHLHLERDPSRNPLFDVCLAMQNFRQSDGTGKSGDTITTTDGVEFSPYDFDTPVSQFDLSLTAMNRDDGLYFQATYCTRLFKESTIRRFSRHFINTITAACKEPGILLKQVDILSEDEKELLLETFNGRRQRYPRAKTLPQLFEEQVSRTPDHIAAVGASHDPQFCVETGEPDGTGSLPVSISYRELDKQSAQLAGKLIGEGVETDSIAAIMLENSIDIIIAILGILKAGAAYLPIDPQFPQKRIHYMLEDSNANVLITTGPLSGDNGQMGRWEGRKIYIDAGDWRTVPGDPVPVTRTSDAHAPFSLEQPGSSLAYVIYTSGTTGRPKGVMLEHHNVVAYVYAFYDHFDIGPRDITIQLASYTFDVFTEELYPLLLRGGSIVVPQKEDVLDIDTLIHLIARHCITIIDTVPQLLNQLNERAKKLHPSTFAAVHTYISGGDTLRAEYVDRLIKNANVYNTYGPTETTVCAAYYRCTETMDNQPPIGQPIANYRVYIMDIHNMPVPIGVPGELHIAGDGVGCGYLNQPELTAEKFTPSPRHPVTSSPFYHSGDLVRWLEDGNIEFLGRIDRQVKIRGFRIELGEIEARLLSHSHIKEAVALEKNSAAEKFLCAYIAADTVKPPDAAEIKRWLALELPAYMIPSYIVTVETIPLTPNGKIDIKALPDPATGFSAADYAAPRTETEEQIAAIWAEVLHMDKSRIGINDNFFDIGGDSLKVIQVNSKLNEADISLTVGNLFSFQTIAAISTHLLFKMQKESAAAAAGETETAEFPPIDWIEENPSVFERHIEKAFEEQLADLANFNLRLTAAAARGDIVREYRASPVQTSSLSLNSHDTLANFNIPAYYEFRTSGSSSGRLDIAEINRIITTFVNENCLFRSIIVKGDKIGKDKKGYMIREFYPLDTAAIPCLDVSGYTPEKRQKIYSFVSRRMLRGLTPIGRLLFRAAIFKWSRNRCHYKVLFAVNHLIFDGSSARMLPEKIDNIRKRRTGSTKGKKLVLPKIDYHDYCQFIHRINYKRNLLEKHLALDDYKQAVKQAVGALNTGPVTNSSFEVDISSLPRNLKNLYNELILLTYARTLGHLLDIDPVPITYISHGRHYKNGNFSDVIGDFHDYIPVLLFVCKYSSSRKNLEDFLKFKSFIQRENLNFISLVMDRQTIQSDVKDFLSPFYFNSLIGLYDDVIGEYESHESGEGTAGEGTPNRSKVRPKFLDLEMVRSPHSDHLWLHIWQNTLFHPNRFKDRFMKIFQQLLTEKIDITASTDLLGQL
jgi:amino acid adenylation domain-containing protein